MAKGFKHGAGGGTPLNFKIVGNPQPEDPKENTIWLNTDVKTGRWFFGTSEPENPSEGMAWITTGISGFAEFNALKKNGITVCPMSAKQYIDGAWVDVTAQIYQGGEWVSWVVYYYKPGDTCDAITGGIYSEYSGNLYTDTHIQMWCGAQQTWCIRTQNMVDLTNISTLYLKMNNLRTNNADTYVKFCVTDKITTNVNDTFDASVRYDAGASETGTNPSLIMDVSNVTGEKYIYVFLQNALKYTESYVNIVEIRGE